MKTYHYNTQTRTLTADLYSPVSLYLKVRDNYTQSVLMESSDYHGEENSHSFIAFEPLASVAINHGKALLRFPDGQVEHKDINKTYTAEKAITEFMQCFDIQGEGSENCGLYGYTAFDAVKYFEPIPVPEETAEKNDAPDIYYIMYRYVAVFNHYNDTLEIVELLSEGENSQLDQVEHNFNKPLPPLFSFHSKGEVTSTSTDEEHKARIRQAIGHCLRGDTFQIVISRRYLQAYEGDDFKLYRMLRSINPSPYLFYFDFGGFRIFGSSPETHFRIKGSQAYIDPIAGTIRRSGDSEKDARHARQLQNDPKENAEHVMLVDLARNDLSRNCDKVKVDVYKELHYYSHVIHLVSRVSGELKPNTSSVKALIDTFPAGTLSGAPKVRAMQLISEIEPHSRGIYGGCIGFMGFTGELNQAIVIRTFVSRNNTLMFQAGGGIVAKSNVDFELKEVNNKLGALRSAIEKANE